MSGEWKARYMAEVREIAKDETLPDGDWVFIQSDTSPRPRSPAEPSARVRARAASRTGFRAAVARLAASDPTQAVSAASKASPARARKCRCLRAGRKAHLR